MALVTKNTPCARFNTPQGCSRGSDCIFLHAPRAASRKFTAASINVAQPLPAQTNAAPPKGDSTFKIKMCSLGTSCEFYDPVSNTADGCRNAHNEDELRCTSFAQEGRCDDKTCTLKHTHVCQNEAAEDPDSMKVTLQGCHPCEEEGNVGLCVIKPFPRFHLPRELESEMARTRDEAMKKAPFVGSKFLSSKYTMWRDRKGLLNVMEARSRRETFVELNERLLLTEITQNRSDVRRYDIFNATISATSIKTKNGSPLFKVPCAGLMEKRPSVLCGDAVLVRDNTTLVWFRGFVHKVHRSELNVSFHSTFTCRSNTTHWVIFSAPIVPYRRQLFALRNSPLILTQDVVDAKALNTYSTTYVVDPKTRQSLNEEQLLAVKRLAGADTGVKGTFNLFVMHGPPGTGKTTTVCAAIRSILFSNSHIRKGAKGIRRVLVCTPTNHAANLIVEKLVKEVPGIGRSRLIRLVTSGVNCSDVKPAMVDEFFVSPVDTSVEELRSVEVLVTTLVSSGMLYQCGMPTDHFDHIIVDEAGQATEPELCIPLLMAGGECPRIALVGDHKQLGPVLRSLVVASYGFADSTMERLMGKASNAEKFSVQLRRSYRSHPDIMNLYNNLTYGGSLDCTAPETETMRLVGTDIFPNPSVPMGFFHVDGVEMREADSPSWMNMKEGARVLILIRRFLDLGVSPAEIVVLSPYVKQCSKIRSLIQKDFSSVTATQLKVCSVESFQGREATVIILSCVRSQQVSEIDKDTVQSIGFLRQPKRLNVAISRAVAALCVVGNVNLLRTDSGWEKLIALLASKGAVDMALEEKPARQTAPSTLINDAVTSVPAEIELGIPVDREWIREA